MVRALNLAQVSGPSPGGAGVTVFKVGHQILLVVPKQYIRFKIGMNSEISVLNRIWHH